MLVAPFLPRTCCVGEDAVQFIVEQTECYVVFVHTSKWSRLKSVLQSGLTSVHTAVHWGPDTVYEEVKLSFKHAISSAGLSMMLHGDCLVQREMKGRGHRGDPVGLGEGLAMMEVVWKR